MALAPAPLLLTLLLTGCSSGGGDDTTFLPGPGPGVPLDLRVLDLEVSPGERAGEVVLRFTAPGEAGDEAADAYVVRTSTRHITAADVDDARRVSIDHAPGDPGTSESIVVGGLEPGRTLQFHVQARHDGTLGPFGLAAAGRVPGADLPAPPAGAIPLTGPADLSTPGATYLLTRDVTTPGTAFRITATDVVLDLGGHTVTYGTGPEKAFGVKAIQPPSSGRIEIRNGAIRQGDGDAAVSHAVFLQYVHDVRLCYLDLHVHGPDTQGVWITEADGDVRVDHCRVDCAVSVVTDRHYPGVTALFVEDVTGALEVDHNRIVASPQWGIRVKGDGGAGPVLVHHNQVLGTKALVSNGYMLSIQAPDAEAYENLLRGESRGVHVDQIDAGGRNAWVHDNDMQVQDQPNPEYPDRHWTHGVKIEGAEGCRVERNRVAGVADPAHADVYALDVTQAAARGIVVRGNRFEAVSLTPLLEGHAVQWTGGASGSAPNDLVVRHNVFTATDVLAYRGWSARTGGLFRENWWVRDLAQGAAHPFRFEYFNNGDTRPSPGHRFLDPYTTESVLDVGQWANPAPYDSSREWTLRVVVRDGDAPVAGAEVTVQDRGGATVFRSRTDDRGHAWGAVLGARVTNGPTFDTSNPHRITVRQTGHPTWEGIETVDDRTAVVVDLGAGTAIRDAEPPGRPGSLLAHPLSASRAVLRWAPAEDDTAVSLYLVTLDGRPAGITDETELFLGGLSANTTYVPGVRALDAGGNLSPLETGAPFTTRPEDRGP